MEFFETNDELTRLDVEILLDVKKSRARDLITYLLENNFNKYQIQLSLYQLLFEQTGLKIEDRRIIHLKESGDFLIYKTEDYTERLQYYLENGYNRN